MRYIRKIIGCIPLILALLACSDEGSYPGYGSDKLSSVLSSNGGWPVGELEAIKVSIDESKLSTPQVTRGTGPLVTPPTSDIEKQRYEGAVWRVFAFRDTYDQQGPLAYSPDFTQRSASEEGKADCLIDGSNYLLGMPALLKNDKTGVLHLKTDDLQRDSTLYYSDHYRDVGYNFFVSYLDDLEPTAEQTHRDETGVYYDILSDGTRDFLVGASPKLTPAVLDENYASVKLSANDRNMVLNVGNYSALAARLGIHPIVSAHHVMSRLCFYAYPADNTAVDIGIESIEIESHNQGKFYVAGQNPDGVGFYPSEQRSYIPLMDKNPDGGIHSPYVPLSPERNTVNWKNGMDSKIWQNNPSTHVGGDMMLAPDSIYRMRITYVQTLKSTNPKTGEPSKAHVTAEYRLLVPHLDACIDPQTSRYMFRAGQIYNINIGVFGMNKIEIIVTLGGWIEGGSVVADDW